MRQPVQHEHNGSLGRGVRRVGQDDVHLRPGIRSAVHGQVVQRSAGVLQVRAEGTAAHQSVPVARHKRGRKCTEINDSIGKIITISAVAWGGGNWKKVPPPQNKSSGYG